MHVISVINRKGGVGKTTIAINLAAALARRKKRVILIDTDPQESATRWARQAKVKRKAGRFTLPRDVYPVCVDRGAKSFQNAFERLAHDTAADVVVIDSPPELSDPALVAALLSDLVLVPVTPSPLDLWAAKQAVETAKEARGLRDGTKPLISLVPSKLITNTILARDIPQALRALEESVSPGIMQRVALVETIVLGQTIEEYAKTSPAHAEFTALATHVLQRIKAH